MDWHLIRGVIRHAGDLTAYCPQAHTTLTPVHKPTKKW